MRNTPMILIGALLLVSAGSAQAQQQAPAPQTAAQPPAVATAPQTATPASTLAPKLGTVDFGFRFDDVSGDPARYQRYRDLRQGAFLERFKFNKETDNWLFKANANNVGYRDQQFGASYRDIGKLKVDFDWTQVPLYISGDTRSLYTDKGNGRMVIDDAVQQAFQNAGAANAASTVALMSNTLLGAASFDMRNRRDIAAFNLAYTINRDVDVKFNLKNQHRDGYNLMSFGFGTSPGLNPVVELGVPTDDRTTDVKGAVEYANNRGLLSVGYRGSWYNNAIPTVEFDNPMRVQDAVGGSNVGGPAFGRAVMWPTNTSVAVDLNGSYTLAPRTKANAYLSFGRWSQDQPLAPSTSNTALVAPPLERSSAETKANITSMVYSLNSRPTEMVWLNAKYRYYDYDNTSALFESGQLVGDWALGTAIWENEPSSITRHNLDLDASITPYKYLGFDAGYSRESSDRTYRIFEKTDEDTFRVAMDSTGNQYVTLRAKYEHSKRTGSGFDEALLDEVGEQPDMRHYDIADRTRDRSTMTLTVTPVAMFDVNASVSTGHDDYTNTGFGLRDNKNNTWSVGFDVAPTEVASFSLNYGEETYKALSYSRTANPLTATDVTFNDPTRDWWTNQDDKVKTFNASLDLMKALPKTDIRVSYDLSDGTATYVYNLKPEQKVFTTTPLVQLAPLKNKLGDTMLDVQYFVRPNLALGARYEYQDYHVDDFALNSTVLNQLNPLTTANPYTGAAAGATTAAVYSGYLYRNYTAHTGWLRMTYLW
jgi:MtrB/PioB family decaheme-associated outer membrane protein